jgi:hypothetical protein
MVLVLLLLLLLVPKANAQEWGSAEAMSLIERAVAVRRLAQADSGLSGYRSLARGFVLFLARVGAGSQVEPRLIKADQLEVEVYWRAPDRSKQNIVAWRERSYLPTDVVYHRDHLGIVTDDFGDRIRLGDGDEVRDVPHPLSPVGLEVYDFALGDSVTIVGAGAPVTVFAVEFRPRDRSQPLAIGTVYLDTSTAALVRFRFGFTPAAYRQRDLVDITVVLERALHEGRWWLPWRQEIEIRRRSAWVEFPFETVIRGQWEISEYRLGTMPGPRVLAGGAYGGLRAPASGDSGWGEPLEAAVPVAVRAASTTDLDRLREDLVGRLGGALSAGPTARLSFGALSDLVRVNRVQGLALGLGATLRLSAGALSVRPSLQFGTADERPLGRLVAAWDHHPLTLRVEGGRRIRDLADWPVISTALNSVLAQEAGNDYGDYVLLDQILAGIERRTGERTGVGVAGGLERSTSLAVAASPAGGAYRDNPALGVGTLAVARVHVERASRLGGPDLAGRVDFEAGLGDADYLRVAGEARARIPAGPGELAALGRVGFGTDSLPPYRAFTLGGRGTLVGEPFRAYGGRRIALLRIEWRLPLGVPSLPLGSFAMTGRAVTVAPYFAAGWAGSPDPCPQDGSPICANWRWTEGIRPVLGVASELLFGLVRIEAGWAIRSGGIGVVFDLTQAWWPVL